MLDSTHEMNKILMKAQFWPRFLESVNSL
jgi:hypothetical protein